MIFGYIVLIAGALLSVLCLYVGLSNSNQTVSLHLFNNGITISAAAALLGGWVSGLISGTALRQLKSSKAQNDEKRKEWQVQDVKLMAEIKSDREKQLEAKIATLETALNKALKKAAR
jgi:uncharacterized protein YgfB (UPF0149 family)